MRVFGFCAGFLLVIGVSFLVPGAVYYAQQVKEYTGSVTVRYDSRDYQWTSGYLYKYSIHVNGSMYTGAFASRIIKTRLNVHYKPSKPSSNFVPWLDSRVAYAWPSGLMLAGAILTGCALLILCLLVIVAYIPQRQRMYTNTQEV